MPAEKLPWHDPRYMQSSVPTPQKRKKAGLYWIDTAKHPRRDLATYPDILALPPMPQARILTLNRIRAKQPFVLLVIADNSNSLTRSEAHWIGLEVIRNPLRDHGIGFGS